MPIYHNTSVTDAKIEIGNYTISVGLENATAASTWTNLGAGMVKSFKYNPVMYTTQAGNAVDPIQGVARETVEVGIDLIEYDGSSFSVLSGGLLSGTTGSLIVGGNTNVQTAKGIKLTNTRKLATGSSQTTTYIINRAFINTGFSMTPKSDNDADPLNVYSFDLLCKQAMTTAQNIFTKTVA